MNAPRRISTATVIVALALVASLGVILWVVSIVRTEPVPVDPTPVATSVPVSTPAASPSPEPGLPLPRLPLVTVERIDRGTLPELLRYSPDRLSDNSLPLSDVAQYANIAGWMHARNIDIPDGPDHPAYRDWEAELENLAIPDVLATRANEDLWVETYGFGLSDIHQVLAVGQAPDFVLVMRGDFDAAALQAAWAESGYQALRREDLTLWSLFPGDAVDLSAPASRPALGNMNNVVVLEDGTVIATSRLARLEQAIRAVRGLEPSLDENPGIAALLAPGTFPYRLETALILKGSILATDPSTPAVMATPALPMVIGEATAIADGAAPPDLPQATLMLAGLEAPLGPDDPATFSLVLSYDSADDAIRAMNRADRAIRLATSPVTGTPYLDRLDLRSIRTHATSSGPFVVEINGVLPEGAADWLAMIEERDLGFAMWPWEP
jgi:hypothetical protein